MALLPFFFGGGGYTFFLRLLLDIHDHLYAVEPFAASQGLVPLFADRPIYRSTCYSFSDDDDEGLFCISQTGLA